MLQKLLSKLCFQRMGETVQCKIVGRQLSLFDKGRVCQRTRVLFILYNREVYSCFEKGLRKKRQKYTRQSRKVIQVSGNQCIVIIKNKESKKRRRYNKKIHQTSAMPRPYGDVSSDFPEILKFGLHMHFNFFSNNFFSEQL